MKIELAVLGMVRYSTKAEEIYILTACVVSNAGWGFAEDGSAAAASTNEFGEYDSPLAIACARRGSDDVFASMGIAEMFFGGHITIPCLVAYRCDDDGDDVVVKAIYPLSDEDIDDAIEFLHRKVIEMGGVS